MSIFRKFWLNKKLSAVQARERALEEVLERVVPTPFHCFNCGYFMGSDEEICCTSCGADLEISDFDTAIAEVHNAHNTH